MVIGLLLNNGYPLSLIFHTLHRRLKKLFFKSNEHNKSEVISDSDNDDTHSLFFNIPYISGFSEKFLGVVRNLNVTLSYTGMNKLI